MGRPLIALDATLAFGSNTGDSAYWNGLIEGLSATESEFDFLLLSDLPAPQEIAGKPNLLWRQLRGKRGRWFSAVTMPMAARQAGARAYHTQYTLSPLAKRGITTIHDVSFFVGPEWFRPRDRFLMQRTVPASARRASRVITVSETSKRDIVRYLAVRPEQVCVTYNAAAEHFKHIPMQQRTPVLRKLGIDYPYLLCVGTRWPRKNMQLAIDAVNLLPEDLEHRLVIVGPAGWGEEAAGGRIFTTGYLDSADLPAVYSGASLFLYPSRYEGFGIPMVEAFACGTPVLSSTGGSLPEISGGAADVIDNWSPEGWAARIRVLLRDSSNLALMRERGLERARDFSWEETARRTLDVYREVAL
jgi:glycosyltransferase involved in cell wall biosynthesis